MIECKDGVIKMEGLGLELLSEYTRITRGFYENLSKDCGSKELARKAIEDCWEMALMPQEELEAKAAEAKNGVRELLKKIEALLDE